MRWTNASVLKLAAGRDPIQEVERRAKHLIHRAKDAGWPGPPYNPARLADILNVPVQANGEIADARTILINNRTIIEYNPTHSRERVRFSLAHEIAHLLFDDYAEKTRHRSGPITGDEWQIEMLCNIAASEFVMPAGSFPDPEDLPSIEALMVNRKELDVSAEAYLIRFAKSSKTPVIMFRASPDENENYNIDYVVAHGKVQTPDSLKVQIPSRSSIRDCVAIGMTRRFEEAWIGDQLQHIEAVGIPNRPGSIYPRVAGLIRPSWSQAETPSTIQYVHGNILYPSGEGVKIVCQLVNNVAKRWGGGVARDMARKFPGVAAQFSDWIAATPFNHRLGRVHFSEARRDLFLASIVAQDGYGKSDQPTIRYTALEQALEKIADLARENNATIHMPRIGTGAAGGDWCQIEEIISDKLVAENLSVTVYDLPPQRNAELSLFD